MQIAISIGVLLMAYILGSIPFGWPIVKMKTGKDIRVIESGRTGGTNAMRAAGFWAGILTAILDILKAASSVWIAQALFPEARLLHVLAPIAVIIGHNYSIFVPKRNEQGRIRPERRRWWCSIRWWCFWALGAINPYHLPTGCLIIFHSGHCIAYNHERGFLCHRHFCYPRLVGVWPLDRCALRCAGRDLAALGFTSEFTKAVCRAGTDCQTKPEWMDQGETRKATA